jgi:hypothetical protein
LSFYDKQLKSEMKMNRTRKFFYNSITTAFLQIVSMIVGFIIPRIMLENYGSEINGLVSSITQCISYFNLVEAGLAGAAVYALYKPLADNDYKAVNGIVVAAKKFYNLSGYMFTILTISLAILYPIFVKTDIITEFDIGMLVLVIGVSGSIEFFTMAKYRVLLTADQKIYIISITSILSIVVNAIILVVLANMQTNIVVLRTFALISVFARTIILYLYINIKYKYINYQEKPNYKALNKRWDALYLQILGSVQIGIPVVFATIFIDLKVVSVYTVYNMIIGGINGVLSIFISGLSSSFGDIIARKDLKLLQKSISEFEFFYYSLLTIIYSTTFILFIPFIKIYTSGIVDINYVRPITGFLFVLNGLLYNLKTPQGMLVISAGMYKETRNQSTIQALIIIVGGLFLIQFWGLNGMMIASILSNLYRIIDLVFFIPRNLTKLPIRTTVYKMGMIFIITILVWLPFNFYELSPRSFLAFFIMGFCIVIYSSVLVALVGLIFERNRMYNLHERLKLILGTKK